MPVERTLFTSSRSPYNRSSPGSVGRKIRATVGPRSQSEPLAIFERDVEDRFPTLFEQDADGDAVMSPAAPLRRRNSTGANLMALLTDTVVSAQPLQSQNAFAVTSASHSVPPVPLPLPIMLPHPYTTTQDTSNPLADPPSPASTEIIDDEPRIDTDTEPDTSDNEKTKKRYSPIKVRDFAFEPSKDFAVNKVPAPVSPNTTATTTTTIHPAIELWDPVDALAEADFRLSQSVRSRPLPGRIIRRLLDIGWIEPGELRAKGLPIDFAALKAFDALPVYPWRPFSSPQARLAAYGSEEARPGTYRNGPEGLTDKEKEEMAVLAGPVPSFVQRLERARMWGHRVWYSHEKTRIVAQDAGRAARERELREKLNLFGVMGGGFLSLRSSRASPKPQIPHAGPSRLGRTSSKRCVEEEENQSAERSPTKKRRLTPIEPEPAELPWGGEFLPGALGPVAVAFARDMKEQDGDSLALHRVLEREYGFGRGGMYLTTVSASAPPTDDPSETKDMLKVSSIFMPALPIILPEPEPSPVNDSSAGPASRSQYPAPLGSYNVRQYPEIVAILRERAQEEERAAVMLAGNTRWDYLSHRRTDDGLLLHAYGADMLNGAATEFAETEIGSESEAELPKPDANEPRVTRSKGKGRAQETPAVEKASTSSKGKARAQETPAVAKAATSSKGKSKAQEKPSTPPNKSIAIPKAKITSTPKKKKTTATTTPKKAKGKGKDKAPVAGPSNETTADTDAQDAHAEASTATTSTTIITTPTLPTTAPTTPIIPTASATNIITPDASIVPSPRPVSRQLTRGRQLKRTETLFELLV